MSYHDVRLPNLFGEHGRPAYNSFVATFCDRLASGLPLDIVDREIPLLHVQDAALYLLQVATQGDGPASQPPSPTVLTISEVGRYLSDSASAYRSGEIPGARRPIERQLFSTLRSFLFPSWYPMRPVPRVDARGRLLECVRARTEEGQTFVSTTAPGAIRGEHYHLRKLERFVVITGRATISLRRLMFDEVVRFQVTGTDPAIVDMPCMWTHNIQNTGDDVLITLFWTDELFDAADTDTYRCAVDPLGASQ
jgi:UDP-2-acetamido-2,6-beta-L-arabino-hexul-4-ose reductase